MFHGQFNPNQPQPKPEGATTVFVLGLLGLLVCGILGIFAWIRGNDYMSRCQAMGVEPDDLAVAGRIMGMIGTVLIALVLLFGVLAMMGASVFGA